MRRRSTILLRAKLTTFLMIPVWGAWLGFGADSPVLESAEPRALQPGRTNLLVLHGKRLQDTRRLWTTLGDGPGREFSEAWTVADDAVQIPIFIPAEIPVGVEMVRVAGPRGVSNPLLVLVDPLPVQPAEPDGPPAVARSVDSPVAIDDVCVAAKSHRYRFTLHRNQRLSIEVVANRAGWETDPVLRVLDSSGRELVYVNDSAGLGNDCGVEFVPPENGEYQVEVRDAEYGGGTGYFFRLRLGEFPIAALPRAPRVSRTPEASAEWGSTVANRRGRAALVTGGDPAAPIARVRLDGPQGELGFTPRLESQAAPIALEIEPNNTAATATSIDSTQSIAGGFDAAGDVDWFRLEIPEAGRWEIEIRSRCLGFPCDPLLRLADGTGATIATPQEGTLDPAIQHRFEAAGSFLMEVREAAGRFGPGRVYVLQLNPKSAGFEIATEVERVAVPVGGKDVVKLEIKRLGYDGPILIEAPDLPAAFTLENPLVSAGKKEWDLEVRCRDSVLPGTWARSSVRARAGESESSGMTAVDLRPAMRKAFPKLLSLPPGFAERVWFCAVAPAPKPKPAESE